MISGRWQYKYMNLSLAFVTLGLAAGALSGPIGLGFLFGGWIGGYFAASVPEVILRRIFAGALFVIGGRLLFSR
jgi:uncharacterized membrane protein YfcA